MKIKILLSIFWIILMVSCDKKLDKIEYTSFETRALQFFVDSLLYKEETEFPFYNKESIMPMVVETELVKDGLFHKKKLATDENTQGISEPYADSTRIILSLSLPYEILSEFDKSELEFLHRNYQEKIENEYETKKISVPEELVIMSWNDFKSKQKDNLSLLYLKVMENIQSEQYYYVQLQVFDYQYGLPLLYNFYIVFDINGNITRWFFI